MKPVTPHAVISLMAAILLLTACASKPEISVSTDYSVANFNDFNTYQWLPSSLEGEGHKADSESIDILIVNNIDKQLAEKGYQQVTKVTPDFYVNYSVTAVDKVDIDKHQTYEGYAPGFTWRRGYGAQATDSKVEIVETNIVEYLEGNLIVDIIEPVNLQIIWRGVGTKKIPEYFDERKTENLITNIVAATLENYPPPSE